LASATTGGEGSRGGNGHPMIVDGLQDNHDDWPIRIMKWRDEVAEGAEKAAAISAEGEILSMERLQLEEVNVL
jgi:hypothetical protein